MFNDEEKVKEILNIYDFDVLCDKIKSIEPKISKEEIQEFMKKFNKNIKNEIDQKDLESVSGGKSNPSYKIMSGLMACLIGLSPSMGVNAAGSENSTVSTISEKSQDKTFIQKSKDWVLSHKLVSGGSGVALITALFLATKMKDQFPDQLSKKDLLARIPNLWQRFWTAWDAARASAGANVYNAAWGAAWGDALDAARASARAAAGASAYDAAGAAARAAARDAAENAADDAAGDAAWTDARDAAFADAWRPGGAAYKIVKDKDRAYFENLANVLEEQIAILQNIVNQNRH